MPVKRSEGSAPVCGFRSHETAAADADGVAVGVTVAVGAGDAVGTSDAAGGVAEVDGAAVGAVEPHAATHSATSARTTMGKWRVALVKASSGDWGMSGRMRRSGPAPSRRGSSPAAPRPTAL